MFGLRVERWRPLYLKFAERAWDWGAHGVVVSGKTVDKIAETRCLVGEGCLNFSPGIGPQGGDAASGAGKGADFVIVGRSVTEAPDPLRALRKVAGQVPESRE